MLQEWISISVADNEIRIDLLGSSVNVSKYFINGKINPVQVRWASLYENSLEAAQQFWFWLRIAIDLAEQIEKLIITPEDFKRVRVYPGRTSSDRLTIVEMGDIFILVPDSLQLVEK